MDCKTARLLLEFARPGSAELHGSEAEALESHLGTCVECDALARSERQLDDHLGRAVRAVPVPDRLRARVLGRLKAERWKRRRGVLAWVARGAAAAAVLAAVTLGVLHWRQSRLPGVDSMDAISNELVVQWADRERVEEWFRDDYKLSVPAPDGFNYALLASHGLVPFQGKQVPTLLFVQGKQRARVYILSDKQFNLQALPGGRSDSGGFTVEVWRLPEHPHFAFLIIYTGDSLKPFLVEDQRQAI